MSKFHKVLGYKNNLLKLFYFYVLGIIILKMNLN